MFSYAASCPADRPSKKQPVRRNDCRRGREDCTLVPLDYVPGHLYLGCMPQPQKFHNELRDADSMAWYNAPDSHLVPAGLLGAATLRSDAAGLLAEAWTRSTDEAKQWQSLWESNRVEHDETDCVHDWVEVFKGIQDAFPTSLAQAARHALTVLTSVGSARIAVQRDLVTVQEGLLHLRAWNEYCRRLSRLIGLSPLHLSSRRCQQQPLSSAMLQHLPRTDVVGIWTQDFADLERFSEICPVFFSTSASDDWEDLMAPRLSTIQLPVGLQETTTASVPRGSASVLYERCVAEERAEFLNVANFHLTHLDVDTGTALHIRDISANFVFRAKHPEGYSRSLRYIPPARAVVSPRLAAPSNC